MTCAAQVVGSCDLPKCDFEVFLGAPEIEREGQTRGDAGAQSHRAHGETRGQPSYRTDRAKIRGATGPCPARVRRRGKRRWARSLPRPARMGDHPLGVRTHPASGGGVLPQANAPRIMQHRHDLRLLSTGQPRSMIDGSRAVRAASARWTFAHAPRPVGRGSAAGSASFDEGAYDARQREPANGDSPRLARRGRWIVRALWGRSTAILFGGNALGRGGWGFPRSGACSVAAPSGCWLAAVGTVAVRPRRGG